jgi:hypothetical protein
VQLIDLFGFTAEEVRARYPATYQWVVERVKPERDQNRDLAEQLDAHRKRQQAAHPALTLTLTGMYNVLEKLRRGEALNAKDKAIHEQGLVSVLKSLHDRTRRLPVQRLPWPATLPAQVAAVARLLAASPLPLSEAELAARFTGKGPWKKRLPQIVDTLEALGRVRRQGARVAGVGDLSGAL